jgi:hypothetical protein
MRRLQLLLAAALATLALVAIAMPLPTPATPTPEAVYIEGGQYTARLHQASRHWRLLPLDGQDVVISNPDIYCRANAAAPAGVWLVARDPAGGLELRAPSHTALPDGHDGRIALLPCGRDAHGVAALHAPQALLDWLGSHNGAVMIDD